MSNASDAAARPPRQGERPPGDVVCFSIFDWWQHGHGHSDFQLMMDLARDRDVLLVNSIGMRMPLPGRSTRVALKIARKLGSTLKGLRTPVRGLPRFHVLSPLMLPAYGDSALRRLNAASVAWQTRAAMRVAGVADPAVVVTVPTAYEAALRLHPRTLVYNRSDKHSAFTEADRAAIEALEGRLLREADVVLYASATLLAEEEAVAGDRGVLLDHAVDLRRFAPRLESRALAGIARPRAGLVGDLRDRVVDHGLLVAVAERMPDVQVVLVGRATSRVGHLAELPNVHLLGFLPYDEIPGVMQALDVGLLPYRDTEWVRQTNPIKLKEYLACGLPVVATDFPAARAHAPWVSVAAGADAFVGAVRRSLAEGPEVRAQRRAKASVPWSARTDVLLDRIAAARS